MINLMVAPLIQSMMQDLFTPQKPVNKLAPQIPTEKPNPVYMAAVNMSGSQIDGASPACPGGGPQDTEEHHQDVFSKNVHSSSS
jgi:hypothetical protein